MSRLTCYILFNIMLSITVFSLALRLSRAQDKLERCHCVEPKESDE